MNVVRCRRRAGVGGQLFGLVLVNEDGTDRFDPARPAINDDGEDRCVKPGGSTFNFLKAVSVELLNTGNEARDVLKTKRNICNRNRRDH